MSFISLVVKSSPLKTNVAPPSFWWGSLCPS
jgi:hypothetical protein